MEQFPLSKRWQKAQLIFPWVIWLLAVALYCHQFFLRISISGMAPELVQNFHINAVTLSTIAAMFYYSYMIMQIPSGLLIDRFGVRYMLCLAALFCTLGSLLISFAPKISEIDFGRIFMGFGAAFAIIGALQIARTWFPASYFPVLNGLTTLIGMLGAVLGGAPLADLIRHKGLEVIMLYAAGISLVLALLCWWLIREAPKLEKKRKHQRFLVPLYYSITKLQLIFAYIFSALLYIPITTFAALWLNVFLRDLYDNHLSLTGFGAISMFLGYGVGSPILGALSRYRMRIETILRIGAMISFLLFALIAYSSFIPIQLILILLFLFGFFLSCSSLAFIVVKEMSTDETSATAFSIANLAQISGGAFILPLIGYILQKHWLGTLNHGLYVYTHHAFKDALLPLLVCLGLAIIFSFFINTKKRVDISGTN